MRRPDAWRVHIRMAAAATENMSVWHHFGLLLCRRCSRSHDAAGRAAPHRLPVCVLKGRLLQASSNPGQH